MEKFPHLKFLQKVVGKPNFRKGNGKPSPITEQNKANKQVHYGYLSNVTNEIKSAWEAKILERQVQNLPLLRAEVIPIFLQVNPNLVGFDFNLKSFGIEIISQEDDGFIIGASLDGFNSLDDKINRFLKDVKGGGMIADFWQIIEGNNWKPEHILSDYLFSIWKNISDNQIFTLEVGIAFDKPLGNIPDISKQGGLTRLKKYREKEIARENRLFERQEEFYNFVAGYGELKSSFIELEDSFCCQIEISGKGFKDLVYNYPFVFEISETEDIFGISNLEEESFSFDVQLIQPSKDSPIVGIIDSGIMEEHKYIAPAITVNASRSYLIGDVSTADYVEGGGHGTRVAGAVLYPNGIPLSKDLYQLPCFIRNIRILDKDNKLLNRLPAELMQEIVYDNKDCKIFNLSINSSVPYRIKHMSSWASTIDMLMNQENVIFIISAGNIPFGDIRNYLNSFVDYPSFLDEPNSRLANPAQSSFANSWVD